MEVIASRRSLHPLARKNIQNEGTTIGAQGDAGLTQVAKKRKPFCQLAPESIWTRPSLTSRKDPAREAIGSRRMAAAADRLLLLLL